VDHRPPSPTDTVALNAFPGRKVPPGMLVTPRAAF